MDPSLMQSGWRIISGRDRFVRRYIDHRNICFARTLVLQIASVVVDAGSRKRMSPLKHVN
jgi:hypothetical protein